MEINIAKKTGILLVNLGTPTQATPTAVKKYLAEFLSDPRVVSLPSFIWWPILHGLVLPTRARQSAKLYQKIWTSEGSPLLTNTQRLTTALQTKLKNNVTVQMAMRYGDPSLKLGLKLFEQHAIEKLLILPLYPQYSSTTTASVFDAVNKLLSSWTYLPEIQFVAHYYQHPEYIKAIANQIKHHLSQVKTIPHLLFSFHGIPKQLTNKGDPYQNQCEITVQKITHHLGLTPDQWTLAYQSRFGKATWLQPYCDQTLRSLAQQGKKNVAVICPGFAVDCLETLEEIALRNRDIFLQAGGERFAYIEALNDSEAQVELLGELVTNSSM